LPRYRNALPQLSGDIYLTDAGAETDLIFNHGIEIFEFATHTLLSNQIGRAALMRYFEAFLDLANAYDTGFILGAPTWKAHRYWAKRLGTNEAELKVVNEEGVRFAEELRSRFSSNKKPIVLNAVMGPRGNAYRPEVSITMEAAEAYFEQQLSWLATTEVDMVTAATFSQSAEAAGLVNAARKFGLPVVVSFTVETNGKLATGQSLGNAITAVDEATGGHPAYFMINCAHPDHFGRAIDDAAWTRRIKGLRANASRRSHAELDAALELDAGEPQELAQQYKALADRMPWLNVFGGCCGTDLRHVTEVVRLLKRP
jgi:S-methylmethionine-dependent homocysteine/selenocysteine methylase